MNPQVTVGYLGWSNVRVGLEFYIAGEGNARWLTRRRSGGDAKGALLQDQLEQDGYGEGTSVVVIALPGRLPEKLAYFLAGHVALKLDDLIAAAEELAMATEDS